MIKKKKDKETMVVDAGQLVEYIVTLIPPKCQNQDYAEEDVRAANIALDTLLWIKKNAKVI